MKTQFKIGDPVFADYQLSLVDDVKDGVVTRVIRNGCSFSGATLSCVPITARSLPTAEVFQGLRRDLSSQCPHLAPGPYHRLSSYWERIELGGADPDRVCEEARAFVRDVIAAYRAEVDGVRLMRD